MCTKVSGLMLYGCLYTGQVLATLSQGIPLATLVLAQNKHTWSTVNKCVLSAPGPPGATGADLSHRQREGGGVTSRLGGL